MKVWILSLALVTSLACSSTPSESGTMKPDRIEAASPAPPAPMNAYPAEVVIMWRLESDSTTKDTTIGNHNKDWKYHGAYRPNDSTRQFSGLAPSTISFNNQPGVHDCWTAATTFLSPITGWSVDETKAIQGHCWNNGVWGNCGIQPFSTTAFSLLDSGGNEYTDTFLVSDSGGGLPSKVRIFYYVVVQPK